MDFQFMRLAFQTLLLCRHYISVSYNIHELLEKSGCGLFFKLKYCDHPLNYNFSPGIRTYKSDLEMDP